MTKSITVCSLILLNWQIEFTYVMIGRLRSCRRIVIIIIKYFSQYDVATHEQWIRADGLQREKSELHGMDHRKRMPRPRNLLMWIGHNKWGITDGLACIVRPSTTSESRMGASINRLRHPKDAAKVEHQGAQSQTILTVSPQLKNSIVVDSVYCPFFEGLQTGTGK